MNGRRLTLVVVVAAGALLAGILLLPKGAPELPQSARSPSATYPPPQSTSPSGQMAASNSPPTGHTPDPLATLPRAPVSTPGLPSPVAVLPAATGDVSALPASAAARIEVEKARLMIRNYHTVMGENPVGTNSEIMQALMGHNPKEATFGPPEGQSLNDKGELVDQWGTPFFFHQLSKDVMEIRSAGPDKVMGTADDAVIR